MYCKNAGRLCAAFLFREWFYVLWMYTPEQNGSSYFLCNILARTFSTTTCRTYLLYPFSEFLVTTCCLYRLSSCSETNQNLFQDVHKGMLNILEYRTLHSTWPCWWKWLWWRTRGYQPSLFFLKAQSKAFCTKKKPDLDRVGELTPRKKKLCDLIWTRESALCKVRSTGQRNWRRFVCWTVILLCSLFHLWM